MKIAFLIDRLEQIDAQWDTGLHLMHECNQRGHTVYQFQSADLYVHDSQVRARMRDVTVPAGLDFQHYWQAAMHNSNDGDCRFESLADLDAIFLHPYTPHDEQAFEYLTLLENRVFMINTIAGMRRGRSKLYLLNFPQFIQRTHIYCDPKQLKSVIESFDQTIVVKPMQSINGEGVIKVGCGDRENLEALIHYYVQTSRPYRHRRAVMVQESLEMGRAAGMIRVLMLYGEILGAMRWMPRCDENQFRGTPGMAYWGHELTPAQSALCRAVHPRLACDGLNFVGLDLIEDKMVDLDCMTPGGLYHINKLNGVRLEERVVDFVEHKICGTGNRRLQR